LEEVERIAKLCKLDMVQLHGDEPPEYVEELKLPVIKCFSLTGSPDPDHFRRWRPHIYLFDTFSTSVRGGSGQTINWEWLQGLPQEIRFILAGGLSPRNVGTGSVSTPFTRKLCYLHLFSGTRDLSPCPNPFTYI
jgi:phosphoribosylanthranilate isomerase